MSVYKKLMSARIALQSAKLSKSGLNKFAGYQYFELADFLPQTQELFSKHGLCGVVSFAADLATLTITDTEDGAQILITSPMAEANLKGCHPIQNLGAVETYTRRYLWVTAMEIVEHDALDSSPGKASSGTIPASFKSSPLQGATDGIGEDVLQYLRDMAMELIGLVKAGSPTLAWEKLAAENLDDEQKPALWTMLDSKTRSSIKAAKPQKETA